MEAHDRSLFAALRSDVRAATRTALVTGAFVAITAAALVAYHLKGGAEEFIDSAEIAAMKSALAADPADDALKLRIQERDLAIREAYFARIERLDRGIYLLLGGLIAFVAALAWAASAASARRAAPVPGSTEPTAAAEARATLSSRWSIAALAVIAAGLGAAWTSRGDLAFLDQAVTAIEEAKAPPVFAPPDEVRKHWPRFRGPDGLGVSAYLNVPSSWNGASGEGILWKTEVPISADNSPVVWGNRVFLSGATRTRREVYCFDTATGALRWTGKVERIPGSRNGPEDIMEDTGYAAPTVATCGRRVYAIFANADLAAFDFDGARVWARNLGVPENHYGYASSLIVYRHLLIVSYDQATPEDNRSKFLALDTRNGKTVWEAIRPVSASWDTPIVITHEGADQLITCSNPLVIAYAPETGTELWRAECLNGDVAPSPVYAGGLVLTVNTGAQLSAIKPDGSGDVTETHIAWFAEDGLPDIVSPAATDDFVYLLTTDGLLTCYETKTGTKAYEQDIALMFNASPSIAGDKLYLISTKGVAIIVQIGPAYKELGRAELGEGVNASPAFQDGRIYIRGKKHLYCMGTR